MANETPQPFQLADPRQQEIYRRLLLLGPGPAAFYRDACRLMAERRPVESLSHIASHLMREIESALRAILGTLPDAAEADASASQERHRRSILRVLIALGIQEDHAVAKSWLGLAGSDNPYGLSARAHRDALARPRPVDNEFISLWDEFQTVLGYVLDRFEGRFLEPHAVLDELLALDAPSTDEHSLISCAVSMRLLSIGYGPIGWTIDSLLTPMIDSPRTS